MPTLKKTVQRPWQPERGVQEGRLYPNTKFYQSTAWRKLRNLKLEQCPALRGVPAAWHYDARTGRRSHRSDQSRRREARYGQPPEPLPPVP
nr:MAG TPA: hypothetical protein [Caudoviricetes sp.]